MDEQGKRIDLNSELGVSRRDLLRRGAIVGGTLLWVAPAIQSLAPKAFAAGASGGGCAACYCFSTKPNGALDHDRAQHGPIGAGGLLDATDCLSWCLGLGAGYTDSRYCSGTSGCAGVAKDENDGELPTSIPCSGTTTRLTGASRRFGVICCTDTPIA